MEGITELISRSSVPITLRVLALLSLTILTTKAQTPTLIGDDCNKSTDQALSGTYQTNVNSTLLRLSSDKVDCQNYVNNQIAISTDLTRNDRVYGLCGCRGDVNSSLCQSCISTARSEMTRRCPNGISAGIWYDHCNLRYSNHDIAGVLTLQPNWNLSEGKNILNHTEFNTAKNYTKSLIKTATEETNKLYAMEEFDLSKGEKRYAMVQCSKELSTGLCVKCLNKMLDKVSECCAQKLRWWVVVPSCSVRYADHKFYIDNDQTTTPRSMPGSPTAKQEGNNKSRILIISLLSGLIATALLSCSIYYFLLQKRAKKVVEMQLATTPINFQCNVQSENSYEDLPTIPFITIKESTNNFSEASKLGEGGFGPVYKGIFPDGREVAVKRLSRTSVQGMEEFKNEVIFIAKLQHVNLVKLLGCYIDEQEKLLVYEYLPNSSLDCHLFDKDTQKQLDWNLRLNIIDGIARGLLYLHQDSRVKIIHRDLKTSNILLDYEMNPKISDFGMAKTFERGQNQANTKRIMGTYGYMAPEYAMEGLFSVKSDVFSFGVLMLEIICGQRNNGFYLSNHGQSLLVYAWKLWREGKSLELMDPTLKKSYIANEVARCIHIGLLCVQEDAADRPTMSGVVLMLASDTVTLPHPNHPAFSVGRMALGDESSMKNPKDPSINYVTVSHIGPR